MRSVCLVVGGLLAVTSTVGAGEVTLDIVLTGPGTWELRASVTDTTSSAPVPATVDGIAAFAVDVFGTGGTIVSSAALAAPTTVGLTSPAPPIGTGLPTGFAQFGFSLFPTVNPIVDGFEVASSQDTLSAGSNDITYRRVGLDAGSHVDILPISWNADVVLATGTYTGTIGMLHAEPSGIGVTLLTSASGAIGGWTGPGQVEAATSIVPDWETIPEPSTLTLAGLSMFGLLAYGWRRRRRS